VSGSAVCCSIAVCCSVMQCVAATMRLAFENLQTQCQSYLTEDGSVPTPESRPANGPLRLSPGAYTLQAICVGRYVPGFRKSYRFHKIVPYLCRPYGVYNIVPYL